MGGIPLEAMGIDHIGKKGPPAAPSPEKAAFDRPAASGRPFEIASPRAVPPAHGPTPVDPPRTALERYRAGEVDVDGYLDLKVHEATAHLAAVPAQDLEAIRNALRDRLASDPTLIELVRAVTGHVPEPPGEE
jgi:hypothetical protein